MKIKDKAPRLVLRIACQKLTPSAKAQILRKAEGRPNHGALGAFHLEGFPLPAAAPSDQIRKQ
jgi:hypothetical protein